MDEFDVNTKLWPGGSSLDIGTDTNSVGFPSVFHRHAANFVTSMDGLHTYQFLFWNTGRHLTNKRHVRWDFSIGGWGTWTATKWYGIPPHNGGGGSLRVHVDPFKLRDDTIISSGTAIDTSASTFTPDAYPFGGNDREIGTGGGPVNVVAKDHFSELEFAGWLQLIWGGDDSGEFVETDAGVSPGAPSFYEHSSGPFHVNQGGSVDLLATYGNSASARMPPPWLDFILKMYTDLQVVPPRLGGDPGPDDLNRLRDAVVKRLLQTTAPVQPVITDFQRFINTASTMSREELTRARQSVGTSLELGKTALTIIDAQLKRGGRQ